MTNFVLLDPWLCLCVCVAGPVPVMVCMCVAGPTAVLVCVLLDPSLFQCVCVCLVWGLFWRACVCCWIRRGVFLDSGRCACWCCWTPASIPVTHTQAIPSLNLNTSLCSHSHIQTYTKHTGHTHTHCLNTHILEWQTRSQWYPWKVSEYCALNTYWRPW